MPNCNFEGYCDRQHCQNSKQCLAKEGSCNYQKEQDYNLHILSGKEILDILKNKKLIGENF